MKLKHFTDSCIYLKSNDAALSVKYSYLREISLLFFSVTDLAEVNASTIFLDDQTIYYVEICP